MMVSFNSNSLVIQSAKQYKQSASQQPQAIKDNNRHLAILQQCLRIDFFYYGKQRYFGDFVNRIIFCFLFHLIFLVPLMILIQFGFDFQFSYSNLYKFAINYIENWLFPCDSQCVDVPLQFYCFHRLFYTCINIYILIQIYLDTHYTKNSCVIRYKHLPINIYGALLKYL